MWKYVKCCLKNKNGCLKTKTKHSYFVFELGKDLLDMTIFLGRALTALVLYRYIGIF